MRITKKCLGRISPGTGIGACDVGRWEGIPSIPAQGSAEGSWEWVESVGSGFPKATLCAGWSLREDENLAKAGYACVCVHMHACMGTCTAVQAHMCFNRDLYLHTQPLKSFGLPFLNLKNKAWASVMITIARTQNYKQFPSGLVTS